MEGCVTLLLERTRWGGDKNLLLTKMVGSLAGVLAKKKTLKKRTAISEEAVSMETHFSNVGTLKKGKTKKKKEKDLRASTL